MNSDLTLKKAPGSFWEVKIPNTKAPEEFVLLKAKKGSYGIVKAGKNSEYFDPYIFKIDSGVINYVGDIKLEIVQGRVQIWKEIKDYYDLSVLDDFDEISSSQEVSIFLSQVSDYELVNKSKNTKKIKPEFCDVIRE